jgi:orotidine-5'-phosphate decarboxylase
MKKFKSFIALDLKSNTQNISIVKKLSSEVFGFKVGYRSFYSQGSKKLLAEIKKINVNSFLI